MLLRCVTSSSDDVSLVGKWDVSVLPLKQCYTTHWEAQSILIAVLVRDLGTTHFDGDFNDRSGGVRALLSTYQK